MTVLKEFHGYFNQRHLKLHLSSDYPRGGRFISGLSRRRSKIGSFEESFSGLNQAFRLHSKDDRQEFKLLDLNHLSSIKTRRRWF